MGARAIALAFAALLSGCAHGLYASSAEVLEDGALEQSFTLYGIATYVQPDSGFHEHGSLWQKEGLGLGYIPVAAYNLRVGFVDFDAGFHLSTALDYWMDMRVQIVRANGFALAAGIETGIMAAGLAITVAGTLAAQFDVTLGVRTIFGGRFGYTAAFPHPGEWGTTSITARTPTGMVPGFFGGLRLGGATPTAFWIQPEYACLFEIEASNETYDLFAHHFFGFTIGNPF